MSAWVLTVVLGATAAAEQPAPLSPPPLIQGIPVPGAPPIAPEPPDDAPLADPPPPPSKTVELEQRLQDWRGRLLDEKRPSLAAPVTLLAVSLAPLLASAVMLGVFQPWQANGLHAYWVPSVVALAVHLAFAIPAAVLFSEKIRERQRFDAAPPPTLADSALAEVSARVLEERYRGLDVPPVPLGDDALESAPADALPAPEPEGPGLWSPTVRAAERQLERERLVEQRDQLLRDMPGRGGAINKFVAGGVLALLSATDWILFGAGGYRLLDSARNAGLHTLGGAVIALGVVLAVGSLVLFLSGRSELLEVDAQRVKFEAEIRDVERRIERLERR